MKYIITCISSGLSKEINSNNYTKFNKILYFYASHPNYKITTGAEIADLVGMYKATLFN